MELSWSSPIIKALLPKSSFQDLLQLKSLLILTWLTSLLQTITLVHEQEIQYTWLDQAPHLHFVLHTVHPLSIHTGVPLNQAMEQRFLINLASFNANKLVRSFSMSCLNYFVHSLRKKKLMVKMFIICLLSSSSGYHARRNHCGYLHLCSYLSSSYQLMQHGNSDYICSNVPKPVLPSQSSSVVALYPHFITFYIIW